MSLSYKLILNIKNSIYDALDVGLFLPTTTQRLDAHEQTHNPISSMVIQGINLIKKILEQRYSFKNKRIPEIREFTHHTFRNCDSATLHFR